MNLGIGDVRTDSCLRAPGSCLVCGGDNCLERHRLLVELHVGAKTLAESQVHVASLAHLMPDVARDDGVRPADLEPGDVIASILARPHARGEPSGTVDDLDLGCG